jgi:pimeloyl-ACP methyl ester carboxylesterase
VAASRRDLPGAGVRLSALQWSPRARRAQPPPFLLHHGLASSAGFWGPLATRLAAGESAGPARTVVAIDARGHGESDRPDDGYDFATVTADLHAALRALGWGRAGARRAVLVGHSWGGSVVLEYAARHPDVAAGIVLVDGGFIELHHMSWEETARELAPPTFEAMTWREFSARAAVWWSATGWDASIEAAMRHNFEELPDGTIRPRLSRERHLRILRAMWEQRPIELYERLRCPVLLLPARRATTEGLEQRFIAGKEQAVTLAQEVLRRVGTPVTVEWFEDSIHDIPLQHPARLAARLQAFAATLPS